MIQNQSEEIQRLRNVLREIVAMAELSDVTKKTIGDYAKAALHASKTFRDKPQSEGDEGADK